MRHGQGNGNTNMRKFHDIKIKHKLILIVMLICISSLVLTGVTVIAWMQYSVRSSMIETFSMQARVMAGNCQASLAFSDAADAEETLATLREIPSVVHAGIITKDGEIFASYLRNKDPIDAMPLEKHKKGYYFCSDSLVVSEEIILNEATIGTVYIMSDLTPLHSMFKRNVTIIMIVLLLVSLVATVVSFKVQKIISGPLMALTGVAETISGEKDYSVRAHKLGNDEIGMLTDAFNHMLGHIQLRDNDLVKSRVELEEKVRERTHDLSGTNKELERFNNLAVGRELKMVELKQEINMLLVDFGREEKYKVSDEKECS